MFLTRCRARTAAQIPMPGLGSVPSSHCGVRLKPYSSHPECHKAHQHAKTVRKILQPRQTDVLLDLLAWSASKRLLHSARNHDPRPGSVRWHRSPLCRAPHSCLLPPKLWGRRKCSNAKAQRVIALGPRLLFGPGIRHTTIRTRLAICHAHGELERDTGGSLQTRLEGKKQKCCPQQLYHAACGSPGMPD